MKRSSFAWPLTLAACLACFRLTAGWTVPVPNLPECLAPVPRITGKELFSGPKAVRLAGGATAQTVVLRETLWTLRNMPQSAAASSKLETEARQLPEAKRRELMDRTDDHIQLWLVSLAEHPRADAAWKPQLTPEPLTNQYHRELAFLGEGRGYAWFGWMPIFEWIRLQAELHLEQGDDPLAGAARGLAIEDRSSRTANSADGNLSEAGVSALPYLKPLLASTDNFQRALSVLSRIPGPEATSLLLGYADSTNRPVAARARYLLEFYPRAEVADYYFKWLQQDAGRAPVLQLLDACAKIDQPRLAPLLPRVLVAPKSQFELRRAFELSRSISGQGIPPALLEAEKTIKVHGYRSGTNSNPQKVESAMSELIHAQDVEAAACIGISLALATTKGDMGPANQAGVSVLKSLPDGRGRHMAKALYDSCEDAWVRERLSEVANR